MSMDFPRGWEIARAVPFDQHDAQCSYRTEWGALLCDCPVLTSHPEYADEVVHSRGGRIRGDEASFLLRLMRLIAEDDDLRPDDLEFAVITGGTTLVAGDPNNPETRGRTFRQREVRYWPFTKGEIIVVPVEGYREPFGRGRSLAKYDVADERFGWDWDAAQRRSAEVKAARDRDAFADPPSPKRRKRQP